MIILHNPEYQVHGKWVEVKIDNSGYCRSRITTDCISSILSCKVHFSSIKSVKKALNQPSLIC